MANEVQGSLIVLAKYVEDNGSGVEGMHPDLDPKL